MMMRAGRTALWLAAVVLCAIPLSGFLFPPVPPLVTASLALIAVIAVWRTSDALLVLAGMGPIAGVIHALLGGRFDGNTLFEAWVIAVLGGAALRAALRGTPLKPTIFDLAVGAFIAVAVASCIAQLPVALLRAGQTDVVAAIADLAYGFFATPPDLVVIRQTALLVEGPLLAALVVRTMAAPALRERLVSMLIAGGAGAAALNVWRLLEVSIRNPPFLEGLQTTLQRFRFNTQFGDLNAAGSYFAMVAVLCAARAGVRSVRERLYAALLVPLAIALWTTGSRVALAATVLSILVLAASRHAATIRARIGWRPVLLGTAAALAVFGLALWLFVPRTRHATVSYSVFTRVELLKVGGRMLADRPIFGVGTSQFYQLLPKYTSPGLQQAFFEAFRRPITNENAHNQFMQILAELGTSGLTAFVAVIALALRPRARDRDAGWPAIAAALAAFFLTSLAGHPLLTPMVVYPFWIVVGAAASGGEPSAAGSMRTPRAAAAVFAAALLATIPLRWNYERKEADLTNVTVGLSPWDFDEAGTRFKWAGKEAALFVSASASVVRLPLRSPDASPRRVEILLDGRPAAGVMVPPATWLDTHVPLPKSGDVPAFRRIDLRVMTSPDREGSPGSLMVGRPVEIRR